jgi:site-specific recombinase XerD
VENGIALSLIQQLLGTNDIRTTLRYTHVADKQVKGIENPLDAIMRKKSHASNSAI